MQIRRAIAKASRGELAGFCADLEPTLVPQRIFDDLTDFDSLEDRCGVYIIFSRKRLRELGSSRIAYIGRGRIGDRLQAKRSEKAALHRLAHRTPLHVVCLDLDDEDMEFIVEGVLLNEHEEMFGDIPKFNQVPGSSTLVGWRSVLRWSPGAVALLRRYGA